MHDHSAGHDVQYPVLHYARPRVQGGLRSEIEVETGIADLNHKAQVLWTGVRTGKQREIPVQNHNVRLGFAGGIVLGGHVNRDFSLNSIFAEYSLQPTL